MRSTRIRGFFKLAVNFHSVGRSTHTLETSALLSASALRAEGISFSLISSREKWRLKGRILLPFYHSPLMLMPFLWGKGQQEQMYAASFALLICGTYSLIHCAPRNYLIFHFMFWNSPLGLAGKSGNGWICRRNDVPSKATEGQMEDHKIFWSSLFSSLEQTPSVSSAPSTGCCCAGGNRQNLKKLNFLSKLENQGKNFKMSNKYFVGAQSYSWSLHFWTWDHPVCNILHHTPGHLQDLTLKKTSRHHMVSQLAWMWRIRGLLLFFFSLIHLRCSSYVSSQRSLKSLFATD